MTTTFTMKSSGPPAGHHPVEFVGIGPFESESKDTKSFGPAVSLTFKVTEGKHQGEEVFVVCSARLSSRSKLGTYACSLNGGPISLGTEVDFSKFIGTKGILVVESDHEGKTKATSFLKTG